MSGRYDVAVVGGGHNGLVAAAYLARAGKSVVVLERDARLGGTAATIEAAPGYRTSACFQSAETFSPEITNELRLAAHGLDLSEARGTAVAVAGGPWLRFDGGGRPAGNGADPLASKDRAALADLEELLARIVGVLAPLYRTALPDIESLGVGDTFDLLRIGWRLRRLGRRDMAEAMRLLPMSMRDVVEERFESEVLGAAVAGLGLQGGWVGPYAVGTAFVALHHQMHNPRPLFGGPQFVAGGLGRFSEALSSAAVAAGADVRTESEVASIDTHGGGAQGVTLVDGGHVEAAVVVSDADPRRTFLSLIDGGALDPDFIGAAANIRAHGGVGVVSFALDGLPETPGAAAENQLAGRIQIGASVVDQERAFDARQDGNLAAQPFLQLSFPSLADPGSAPAGKQTATAWILGVPDDVESLADSTAAAIEDVLPGFAAKVSGAAALTPVGIEAGYGATNGCLFDVDVSLDQALFLRPLPGWYGYRTPLRGIYLCGSGTHAGGGITGLPGRNAARRIIGDLKTGRAG